MLREQEEREEREKRAIIERNQKIEEWLTHVKQSGIAVPVRARETFSAIYYDGTLEGAARVLDFLSEHGLDRRDQLSISRAYGRWVVNIPDSVPSTLGRPIYGEAWLVMDGPNLKGPYEDDGFRAQFEGIWRDEASTGE